MLRTTPTKHAHRLLRRFGTAKLNPQSFITPAVSIERTQLLIDGKFIDSVSGKTFETIDPRTEKTIASVAEANQQDVEKAIQSSRRAFDDGAWPRMGARDRGKILTKVAERLEADTEKLALLETWDSGKIISEARMDMQAAAEVFRYFGGYCDKIEGKTLRLNPPNIGHINYEPYGVVGIITPWNYPLTQVAVKLAPAICCGNTAVVKPAESAPLTTLLLGEILLECGMPKGAVNIVQGFGESTGAHIVNSPDVDVLSFTGEANTGKKIMAAAAQNLTPVVLELGGKSPFIVYDDADIEAALDVCMDANFFNAGQVCCATTRVYVQEAIYDEYVEGLLERTKERKVGDPFDESVSQGPQQNREVFEKILGYLEAGKSQSKTLVGGNRVGDVGYFVEPTIFEVEDNDRVAREEIFGPCMALAKFSDEDEVIRRANDTPYGLGASVFSTNSQRLIKTSRSLKAGSVWMNTYGVEEPSAPFGGFKNSGIGRDLGGEAIKAFTQCKTFVQDMGDAANCGPYM